MRKIRTFSAMIFLATLFLIFFYSTLPLETIYSHRAAKEALRSLPSVQPQVQDVITKPYEQESITSAPVDIQNVNVSKDFRKAIPPNAAYWNRLLYSTLVKLDKGENPLRQGSDWPRCMETNQELLRTNLHDFNSYPNLFQEFVQGMGCRTPPVLINQPKKCVSGSGVEGNPISLLFAIKSTPGHFEQRQAVRETWGREGLNSSGLSVHTVFLMGSPRVDDPDLSQLLSYEASLFKDILQWDFNESFLNLTLKMYVFLQWSLKYCPHVTFVFSGDDDVFVNTPLLLSFLQSLDSSKASTLYSGDVIKTASPIRNPQSKYNIPLSFYDGPYPAYVGGGGFLISGALLKPLYSVSHFIPFYPIDDVYTGMCFKALGVSPKAHTGFHTFDIKEGDRENLCVHKGLILTHKRSPQQTKKLWRGIHSPFLTC
ncbi:N-acetyllactosaminide beta-1,3-N-acetylglucosaminyltransferase 2 [Labrus bergylta]|uniref:N-acetyllactosaminide beta-1,3-N-acetylglucosaminyltransferase 2 n=1 Tax=Labrus bergylta TaxID=56723 RepID=UPI0033133AB3